MVADAIVASPVRISGPFDDGNCGNARWRRSAPSCDVIDDVVAIVLSATASVVALLALSVPLLPFLLTNNGSGGC